VTGMNRVKNRKTEYAGERNTVMAISNFMPPRMAFGGAELQAVKEVFDFYKEKRTDFGYQSIFEQRYTDAFVKYMEVPGFADAVSSGTAALFVALASLQLKPGSHVIVSPITDPGTLSAIILNQLKPVVADAAPDMYNIGVQEFLSRVTDSTKAVVVVHSAGQAAPIAEISRIAADQGIYVVEDCSQAHGAKHKGKKVGTFGDVAAFSTMYRKAHATGGCGGIVFTRNEERYKLVRSYADRGKPFFAPGFDEKDPEKFLFPALNLNADEISCAIGLSSLAKLDDTIHRRLLFLQSLHQEVKRHSRVCKLMAFSKDDSPFFLPIFVDSGKITCPKTEFAELLAEHGVSVNPHYKYVVSEWPWVSSYLAEKHECTNAAACRNQSFNLLFNENCGEDEVKRIVNAILATEETCVK